MCILAIWTSFFEKSLFSSFSHFFTRSLIFWKFSFLSSLYIVSLKIRKGIFLFFLFQNYFGYLIPFEF
jgi:hypothetical protein